MSNAFISPKLRIQSKNSFKVVRILDEFSIVIDGGYDDGIKYGDIFQVYLRGEEIYDPSDQNTVIGVLDKIKATIIATEIMPDLSVCKNFDKGQDFTIPDEFKSLLSLFASVSRPLKVDPSQVTPLNLIDEPIKLGDLVRKIPK